MKNTLKIVNKDIDQTLEFQKIIDSTNVNETLRVVRGTYLISNIFFHSNMRVIFEEGVIFINNYQNLDYKLIDTRIAGINMKSYAGILNIIDCKNVKLEGHAIIDGRGDYFYNLYWGKDTKGGLRKIYDAKGIRPLCDYDLKRPRNLLIQNSSNIIIDSLESKDSAFWNIHVLYTHDVVLKNIVINCKNLKAPSTDGIDIDSSYNVKVIKATTYTNDDSICIKSGRDSDGIMTNIPSHDIEISDCTILKGFGITIGSEVSGGIFNVNIHDIKYINTDCGFRIKSSPNRKGYIKNVTLSNLDMIDVKYPIHVSLDWNKNYSNLCIKLPSDYKKEEYVDKLLAPVDDSIPNTIIDNIVVDNLNSKTTSNKVESRAFEIIGFKDSPIMDFKINNSNIVASEFGRISFANVIFNNVKVNVLDQNKPSNDDYDNR